VGSVAVLGSPVIRIIRKVVIRMTTWVNYVML
jgi:hypothetical protein